MNQATLDQLLDHRRAREQRATELLTSRLTACERTHEQANRARDEAVRHAAERRQREALLLQGLEGRRITLNEIERYKARLADLAAEAERMWSKRLSAEAEARRWDALVDEARAELLKCRRDRETWQVVTEKSAAAETRPKERIEEIETESQASDPGASSALA